MGGGTTGNKYPHTFILKYFFRIVFRDPVSMALFTNFPVQMRQENHPEQHRIASHVRGPTD